jgi:hypothetical protein
MKMKMGIHNIFAQYNEREIRASIVGEKIN